jgi:hypothetical protein
LLAVEEKHLKYESRLSLELVFLLEKDKKMLVKESKKSVDHNLKNEAHMQLGLKMTGGVTITKKYMRTFIFI